jgi:transcriptional regulator with XRE-family HTH domain
MARTERTQLDHDLLYGRWTVFGRWLKQQRELAGLTQDQAAKAMRVSKRQWIRYEMGGKVLEKKLKRMARVVNVAQEKMLDRAGYKISLKRNAAKDRLGRIYDLSCAGKLDFAILELLQLNDRIAGSKTAVGPISGGPEAIHFSRAIASLNSLPSQRVEVILKTMQERIKDKTNGPEIGVS